MEDTFVYPKQNIRKLFITILDDNDGITADSYSILADLLLRSGNGDILKEIIFGGGRIWIPESFVEENKPE